MPYEFDRYVDGQLMAEGAIIFNAESESEAVEIARKLFSTHGRHAEAARTVFVSREPKNDNQ